MKKFIENMDSKISPTTGNLLRKIFMWITIILIFVVMPVICFTIGSIIIGGTVASWVGPVAFIPWFALVLITSTLWIYFSKWTEK